MIVKRYIAADLSRLDALFQEADVKGDIKLSVFFAKLGVLELCGWIEASFDDIALRAAKGRVLQPKFRKLIDKTIDNTHGFKYDSHFLGMLSHIVGLPECEELEGYLNSDGSLNVLKGEIGVLIQQRNHAAHVPVSHKTMRFDAPSVCIGRLKRLYPILRDVYGWFCRV